MDKGRNDNYTIFAAKNNESITYKYLRCDLSTSDWKCNGSKCSFWKIRKIDIMSTCSIPDVNKGPTE